MAASEAATAALHPETGTRTQALRALLEEIRRRESEGEALTYRVPTLWRTVAPEADEAATGGASRPVNPYSFYRQHIEAILTAGAAQAPVSDVSHDGGDWVRDALIYNMFVRLATAFDHDGDGSLGHAGGETLEPGVLTVNGQGVRESGTFLKALALLGHIRHLGCNAIHLLPVTSVGRFGNKGNLGSPYAIRNPYHLEDTLADPLVEADVDLQFRAFVEACHLLGIRVIVEFVFRTSSRDGDPVKVHPEWFYWIRREVEDRPAGADADDARYYGNPPFPEDELAILKAKVSAGELENLPAPPEFYRHLFCPPPPVSSIEKEADGRFRGVTEDGTVVHVPSAFADWPPDDIQPPWTDVTYLRLYNDPPEGPSFNYIAYNTIRMYDLALARPENANRELWDAIRGIIPHYQREYGIDGVMIDMGHAIPHDLMADIIALARQDVPDFCLLSENFVVSDESRKTGYNAVLGYQFQAISSVREMRRLVERACVEGMPIPTFGCGETHNTPRVAMRERGARFCRTVWLLNCFLPDTIPFLHNGFELGDERPVNLGLAFTPEEIEVLGTRPLALFDMVSLDWDAAGTLPADMARISGLRSQYRNIATASGPQSFAWLEAGSADVVAFLRRSAEGNALPLYLVLNWGGQDCSLSIPAEQLQVPAVASMRFRDVLSGRVFAVEGNRLVGTLAAYDGLLLVPMPM